MYNLYTHTFIPVIRASMDKKIKRERDETGEEKKKARSIRLDVYFTCTTTTTRTTRTIECI